MANLIYGNNGILELIDKHSGDDLMTNEEVNNIEHGEIGNN